MTPERRQEFDHFCRFNRNNTDIWRWLVNEGHVISLSAVDNWRNHTFPVGEQAKALNQLGETYDGLEGDRSIATVEGIALTLLRQMTKFYMEAANKLDPDIMKTAGMVAALMREARSAAASREEMKYIKDRSALEMAGAMRMADILIQTFEGTSTEDALREAVQGAMMQIEQESKGG